MKTNSESSNDLVTAMARLAKIPVAELLTSMKKVPTAFRSVLMVMLRERGMTFAQIAALVGRDASTIQQACAKLKKESKATWFVALRNKAEAEIERKRKVDALCRQLPSWVYAAAYASEE
jgi:chromosomal replication initiation ATPase DnaA